jgi:DNA-binding XRE family transcriptional regulator
MQRRTAPRIRVKDVTARVRKKGLLFNRGSEEQVRVFDIGPKGMSFSREEATPLQTQLRFVIEIPNGRKVKCVGRIKNLRGSGTSLLHGVEFTRLSKQDRDFLGNTRNIFEFSEANPLEVDTDLQGKLKTLRNAMGLTVVELANVSGVSPSHISEIESGREEDPSLDLLHTLARGMGITVEDLRP